MLTVYTKPGCPQCNVAKNALNKAGVQYETVDISKDPQAREYIIDVLKVKSLPVLEKPKGTLITLDDALQVDIEEYIADLEKGAN